MRVDVYMTQLTGGALTWEGGNDRLTQFGVMGNVKNMILMQEKVKGNDRKYIYRCAQGNGRKLEILFGWFCVQLAINIAGAFNIALLAGFLFS